MRDLVDMLQNEDSHGIMAGPWIWWIWIRLEKVKQGIHLIPCTHLIPLVGIDDLWYIRYRSIMSIHPGSTIPGKNMRITLRGHSNSFLRSPPWNTILTCFWHTIWKYIWHICSGILSDILSGIYFDILFYLTYLASILTYFLACILTFFLACIHILSGILSGIYSDIFSIMHSGILSGIYSDMSFGIPRWFQIQFYKSVLLKWMLSVGLRFINGLNTFWLILTHLFTWGSRLSTTDGHQDFRVAGVYCIDVNFIEDWERCSDLTLQRLVRRENWGHSRTNL